MTSLPKPVFFSLKTINFRKHRLEMKPTKGNEVRNAIQALEVGQSINKKAFIKSVWGDSDYFIDRSFDVMFNTVKKELADREFKTRKGLITRIK